MHVPVWTATQRRLAALMAVLVVWPQLTPAHAQPGLDLREPTTATETSAGQPSSPAASPSATPAPPRTPSPAPSPSTERVPEFVEVRVHTSNVRRVQWGHALTIVGVVGILSAAAGMVIVGQGADRYRGLNTRPAPLPPQDQARLDRLRTQRRLGLSLLVSGLSIGIGGLIAGPLLVRSGRRRQRAQWQRANARLSLAMGPVALSY